MTDVPRLKTELWVQAFLRACETRGQYGAVVHKGAAEAGALHVAVNHLDGSYDLLSPAPGPAFDDKGERRFSNGFGRRVSWPEIAERMQRARRIDSDLWLVEVEDRNGLAGLQQLDD